MAKPRDPNYWKKWRAEHPEYAARQNELRRARRAINGRGNRAVEYAKRASRAVLKPPLLFPQLRHGTLVSYWDEELRMDLEQERALAVLEGRDPDKAAKEYRARETKFSRLTAPLLLTDEVLDGDRSGQ